MKTVLIFAGLVALALATAPTPTIRTKAVDNGFVERQRKILGLFESPYQLVEDAEYYKIGKEYNIEANIENYTNKKAVEEFLLMYRTGFMPKEFEFSVFYENMRDEAISLFHVFYYAKDFETFYKTAAFAKVHLNEGQFLYALYIAVLQRTDTHGLVMPAPYEIYPQYFASKQMFTKAFFTKMQKDEPYPNFTKRYNIAKVEDKWVFYSNYSNSLTYPNEEVRLSYFTEDIELNSYYYNFHSHLPFWWNANKYPVFKERRGEIYFYFYQQLLARYYLERLTNGLGGIPEFSWFSEFKTGYFPPLTAFYLPYAQRSNGYDMHSEMNYERIRFLDTYEKTFFQYLQSGQFKAFEKEIDFHNPKALNFVGNYWQTNADLYSEESTKDFQHSYEIAARRVLGAAPALNNKYIYVPSALDNYQTSLRDPAFYQLYQRIVDYMIEFKEYLIPYTKQDLAFKGVEVTEVKVDKLVTFFEYFDFNITNRMYFTKEELKTETGSDFMVRQPRLNHQPFLVTVDVKSEVATDAVVKFFLGPKYDSNGQQLSLEQDWMKFYELDWSIQKLVPGENKITRVSNDFTSFKDEFVPMSKVKTYLDEGKVPFDMSEDPDKLTRRLMLPRGTAGGYPLQLFVFVYPYKASTQTEEMTFMNYIMDNKPFGYPLDRPLQEINFQQPNAYFKQVNVYHEGSLYYYNSEVTYYFNTIYSQLGKKHA